MKHINVIHHYIRGLVEKEKLSVEWISSIEMLTNGLIKIWLTTLFKRDHDLWDLN